MSDEDPKRWDLTTKVKALVCCWWCWCSLTKMKLLSLSLVLSFSPTSTEKESERLVSFADLFSLLFSSSRSLSLCYYATITITTDW